MNHMFLKYTILAIFILFNWPYCEAQKDTLDHTLDTIRIQEATIIGFYRADGHAPATFKNLDLKDLSSAKIQELLTLHKLQTQEILSVYSELPKI